MNKRYISVFLIILMTFGMLPISNKAMASKPQVFEGTRIVEFVIDRSDMNNFINGGRSEFDIILRSSVPANVTTKTSTYGQDITIQLIMEFTSFEQYSLLLKELLGYEPMIVYENKDEITLYEDYPLIDLFNFIQPELDRQEILREKSIEELFGVTCNKLQLNGTEYEFDGNIAIGTTKDDIIPLDSVIIESTQKKNGEIKRNITIRVSDRANEVHARILKAVGKTTKLEAESVPAEIRTSFTALNEAELIRITRECLGVNYNIFEKQSMRDDGYFDVERVEYVDTERMLTEEGTLVIKWNYALDEDEITLDDETCSWNYEDDEKWLTSYNQSRTRFFYKRGFRFDKIEMNTSFPKLFGKIRRKISLSVSTASAKNYHAIIAKQLEEHLAPGMELKMFDESGVRYYEINFASWSMSQIKSMTKTLFDDAYEMQFRRSIIPFGKETLTEEFDTTKLIRKSYQPKETIVTYELPGLTTTSSENKNVKDGKAIYESAGKVNITLSYNRLNILYTVVELLAIVVIAVTVILVLKKKKNPETAQPKRHKKKKIKEI